MRAVLVLLTLVACKSKEASPPPAEAPVSQPASSGSGLVTIDMLQRDCVQGGKVDACRQAAQLVRASGNRHKARWLLQHACERLGDTPSCDAIR